MRLPSSANLVFWCLASVNVDGAKRLAELRDLEADLAKAYKGRIPPDQLAPILEARKQVKAADDHNEDAFRAARKRLVQRLYHEAFHAYLTNAVYPPADGEAPRLDPFPQRLVDDAQGGHVFHDPVRLVAHDPDQAARVRVFPNVRVRIFPKACALLVCPACRSITARANGAGEIALKSIPVVNNGSRDEKNAGSWIGEHASSRSGTFDLGERQVL